MVPLRARSLKNSSRTTSFRMRGNRNPRVHPSHARAIVQFPGGPVSYSLGGTHAQNIIYSSGANLDYTNVPLEGESESLRGSHGSVGLARPSRDTGSYFAEVAIPLIGSENTLPAVHSLFLTLQGNYTTTESRGAAGVVSRGASPRRAGGTGIRLRKISLSYCPTLRWRKWILPPLRRYRMANSVRVSGSSTCPRRTRHGGSPGGAPSGRPTGRISSAPGRHIHRNRSMVRPHGVPRLSIHLIRTAPRKSRANSAWCRGR